MLSVKPKNVETCSVQDQSKESESGSCENNSDTSQSIEYSKVKDQKSTESKIDDASLQKIKDFSSCHIYCIGYERSGYKTVFTYTAMFFTLGLLRLVFHWYPYAHVRCTHRKCRLPKATTLAVIDQYDRCFIEHVKIITVETIQLRKLLKAYKTFDEQAILEIGPIESLIMIEPKGKLRVVDEIRYFDNKKVRYVWNSGLSRFGLLRGLDNEIQCSYFLEHTEGLSFKESTMRLILYGSNALKIGVKARFSIFSNELIEYIYVLQTFSIFYWFVFEEYFYYPVSMIALLMYSLITDTQQIYTHQRTLQHAISGEAIVWVKRKTVKGEIIVVAIQSGEVVPGDVIIIPHLGGRLYVDAVIVKGRFGLEDSRGGEYCSKGSPVCMSVGSIYDIAFNSVATDGFRISKSCVVNEASITGESIPVVKSSIATSEFLMSVYDSKLHTKCTLLSGTEVIQTRSRGLVEAMVIRTGFRTERGVLVSATLYPKPADQYHFPDVNKLIAILLPISAVVFLILMSYKRLQAKNSIFEDFAGSFDILTIALPAGLPAAMSIAGTSGAQDRLNEVQIFCTSPRHLIIGGSVSCFCFDKTGTLTEGDLDFKEMLNFNFPYPIKDPWLLRHDHPLRVALASCHMLTTINGKLTGDPSELKLFKASNFMFDTSNLRGPSGFYPGELFMVKPMPNHEPTKFADNDGVLQQDYKINAQPPDFEVGVLLVYPFSSLLRRMSVITRVRRESYMNVYTKGAPEIIEQMCAKESISQDFYKKLASFTSKGYRVFAVATKKILIDENMHQTERFLRTRIECNLTMLGLIVMEDRLKAKTIPVLKELQIANIRTIMVTGDNELTALSVARECGMIDPDDAVIRLEMDRSGNDIHWFYDGLECPIKVDQEIRIPRVGNLHIVTTGNVLTLIRRKYPEIFRKVIARATVLARMSPDLKTHFVKDLQALGYSVGFCGDGLNDCGALKVAHVGITLLKNQASVDSPFTTSINDISCVPKLISECRAALVTSCAVLRYMACFAFMQITTVFTVELIGARMSDMEFIYIELVLSMGVMAFFGTTHSSQQLAKTAPAKSALSLMPFISIVVQALITFCIQFSTYYLLYHKAHSHYLIEWQGTLTSKFLAAQHTVAYIVSSFQYMALAIGFSAGRPHRQSLFKNRYLMAYIAGIILFSTYLALVPANFIKKLFGFQTELLALRVRVICVLLGYFHIVLSFITENQLMNYLTEKYEEKRLRIKPPEYLRLDQEVLNADPESWLPKCMSEDTDYSSRLNESPEQSDTTFSL